MVVLTGAGSSVVHIKYKSSETRNQLFNLIGEYTDLIGGSETVPSYQSAAYMLRRVGENSNAVALFEKIKSTYVFFAVQLFSFTSLRMPTTYD